MSSCGTPATVKAIKPRRLTGMLAIAFGLSVFGAVAEGQTVSRSQNSQQTKPIAENNPCNGRPMSGQGTIHTQINESSSGDITEKTHLYGQLIDVADPTQKYQYQSWETGRLRASSGTEYSITTATRKHVIHEGQRNTPFDGSYFQWVEFTTYSTGEFTVKQSKAECKSESGVVVFP